jgi:glutamate--cysteine ligase
LISVLKQQLDQLTASGAAEHLKQMQHGIEKEGLRVLPNGHLSQQPHPKGLGSALTNDHITTDYSEALLEFITPVFSDPAEAIQFLADLHRYGYQHLSDELIWAGSMPCTIDSADEIPIAEYGDSNIGRMKHVYRVGLEHRYGKIMQTIAGIHYNFSLPDAFLAELQKQQGRSESLQTFRSFSYFKLIRNFRRFSWMLLYLFGASPALSDSFMQNKDHQLERLSDHTLYLPYATSLRMSDLGYSNKAQSSLNICFNHLHTYIQSLSGAIRTPYPKYETMGVKVDGEYRQLNTNILQIENEYYSDIRPKRVTKSGEKPIHALQERGVEYIEVRNTDINPMLPAGMDDDQARFLDTFLVTCLLIEDKEISLLECDMLSANLQRVVTRGREPELTLETLDGEQRLDALAYERLDLFAETAKMLDQIHGGDDYQRSVNLQRAKVDNPDLTPSAQVLASLKESGLEHTDWLLKKSQEHRDYFMKEAIEPARQDAFDTAKTASLAKQAEIEAADTLDFDAFLAQYMAS